MAADNKSNKDSFSLDWLVGGVLTKLGDTFDRFMGRDWNPSSSLATSRLIEKLKILLNSEVRDLDEKGKFVPHIIKLKIQWNKFSTEDSEEELKKLEHELHAAAIDHINDRLYHTYAPLEIEIQTDYFTEGVRMLANFGKFSDKSGEAAVNVTVPNLRTEDLIKDNKITVSLHEQEEVKTEQRSQIYTAKFSINNIPKEIKLDFSQKKRISVGRFKENDLSIPDQSVSKVHASIVLNNENQLLVADTGSTNGTFINGERIIYGKASPIENGQEVKFGDVEVRFEKLNNIEDLFEEKIPKPTQTLNQTTNGQMPAQDEIADNEKEKSINLENEEIKPQPEIEENDKSRKINIDKTQDWKI